MEVAGRRQAEAALQRGPQVGNDVAEEVVGDDHVELGRVLHHQQHEGIDVEMTGLHAGVLRRHFLEDTLPQGMTLGHRVALVRHAHAAPAGRLRELEGVLHDPVHALVRIQLFLNRHFIVGPGLEASADPDIQALGILAEHDEVHVRHRPILQRTEPRVEQLDRPVVDVEIELEPNAEQDVARVPVVGHAWITERADEDRVEVVAQHRVAVGRHRDAGPQEMIGAPGKGLDLEPVPEDVPHRTHGFDRRRRRLDADAVAGDDS